MAGRRKQRTREWLASHLIHPPEHWQCLPRLWWCARQTFSRRGCSKAGGRLCGPHCASHETPAGSGSRLAGPHIAGWCSVTATCTMKHLQLNLLRAVRGRGSPAPAPPASCLTQPGLAWLGQGSRAGAGLGGTGVLNKYTIRCCAHAGRRTTTHHTATHQAHHHDCPALSPTCHDFRAAVGHWAHHHRHAQPWLGLLGVSAVWCRCSATTCLFSWLPEVGKLVP